MKAIEMKHICKSFGEFAIRDLSLTVPSGTICGLVGENGAGKSTTIRLLMNALRPDGGTARVLGVDVSSPEFRAVKEDVGVVLDEAYYPETLTAVQVGKVMAGTYKRWDQGTYDGYLRRFDLPGKKPFKDFSRGMKMKLSLSAALAHRPKLLILDEATAGLDPVVRDEILDEFLGFIQDEEHAILMSSHITSDLEKVADYIAYIHQGEVVLSDSKDNILDSYGRVACTAGQLEAIDPHDILHTRRGSFGCEALVKDRTAFARKYPMLLVERTTLEDIMLFVGKGEVK